MKRKTENATKCPFCGHPEFAIVVEPPKGHEEYIDDIDDLLEDESIELQARGVEVGNDLILEVKCENYECNKIYNIKLNDKDKTIKVVNNIN